MPIRIRHPDIHQGQGQGASVSATAPRLACVFRKPATRYPPSRRISSDSSSRMPISSSATRMVLLPYFEGVKSR